MRIMLDVNQVVTINATGRRAVVSDVEVNRLPDGSTEVHRYLVRNGNDRRSVRPDEISPVLLDLDEIDAKIHEAEASGLVDGPDAPYNWAALALARAAEDLRAEVGYLRRRLEMVEGYTRLGPRDGAIVAGADALMEHMRRAGELDAEVDAATEDSLRELAEAAVVAALPVLAAFADRLQELHDLLPGPCPVPDVMNGSDQCEHGTWSHCPATRAAWLAAGLDPLEAMRTAVAEARRRYIPEYDSRDFYERNNLYNPREH